jgi:hypothetical protein
MDPWYYFGHFIHFPHYQQLHPTYAGERLPWLLPGILLNRIFQPAYAELALHFCCYWISLFSLYYLVRRLTNDATALLAAVLMGSHPMFIAANGCTYLDSGCILYLLLAFVCLMRSLSASRKAVWLIAAGACWAALVYTYILWIVLTPCCAIFYLGLTAESDADRQRLVGFLPLRHLIAAGQFVGGTLLATAGLQTVHLLIYGMGHGFFFRFNIAFALAFENANNTLAKPGYAWITSNSSLVFPEVTFVICLVGLFLHHNGRRRLNRASLGALWTYVYSFVTLVFLTVQKNRALEFSYCDSMLIPLLFLALGVTALPAPKRLAGWLFCAVLAIAFLLSTLSLWKAGLYIFGLPHRLWVHCVIAVVGAMLPLFSARRLAWVVSVVCLAGASFGLVPQSASVAWVDNYNGLSASIRIGDAIKRIESSLPYDKYPVFWMDNFTSQYSNEYRAIMCAFLSHNVSMWHYPKIDVGVASLPAEYPAGTPIVLITDRHDVFERARSAMADMGMPLRLTGQQLVSRDNLSYWLTFTEVVNPTEEPGTGAVSDAIRVPLADGLQLAYAKAELEKVGRRWRVVTAAQQWAYAASVTLPTVKTARSSTIRIRGRMVRGKVGFGLLNRSGQFATEQFVDGPFQETELSLPFDVSDNVSMVMVRNGGGGGPAEVVLDSIDLALAGRKVTDLEPSRIIAASTGVSVNRGRPTTIQWTVKAGSGAASIPLSLKRRSNGLFYLEVKAQMQSGKMSVEVVDRNSKDNREKVLMGGEGVTEDVFVRIPAGLQEGDVSFRNAASTGIASKAIILDVVLWEVI